jgi:hypothetical protein
VPQPTPGPTNSIDCGAKGCLYNVLTDPTEHDEISGAHPSIVAELQAIIKAETKGVFNPDRGADDGLACTKAFNVHGGFWGPFLDK